jgi:hypothetical protein
MKFTNYLRNILIAAPFYVATLVPFIALAQYLQVNIQLGYVFLGALGWWIALILRLPAILAAKVIHDKESVQKITIGASGPTEELVRLALLVILGLTTENALSVCIGWAAIEIVYSLIQNVAMGVLDQKTDEKAMEAKEMLRQQGMEKSLEPSAPYWGILERLSANALHISFGLLLVVNPLLIAITAPLHSAFNFVVINLVKKSLAKAEIILAILSLILIVTTISLIKL